jgi:predicted metal-dependent hydrolase
MSDLLQQGIVLFQKGHFFDAHEVWEELWRGTSPGLLKLIYQGLIQGAVGMHHLRRGNHSGARAQLQKSIAKLSTIPEGLPDDVVAVIQELRKALETLDIASDPTPGLQ